VADFDDRCVAGHVEGGGKSLFDDLSVERACPYLLDIGLSADTSLRTYWWR
jgi:hypothetical protein